MVATSTTGAAATFEEIYDWGIVEEGGGIHMAVRDLPATLAGKKKAMSEVGNGKGVFIRMAPDSTIYEVTGSRYASGTGYLVATTGADARREVSFGNFVSGGVAIGGDVVTHIFQGVTEGSLYRRRCTAQEAVFRDTDWRLTKVRFADTFYFEVGMSDGEDGIVGGAGNVKAYAADEFFRLFVRPTAPGHVDRRLEQHPDGEDDDEALLVGKLERGPGFIDVGQVGFEWLLTVLRACGASESADHVWYQPEPLLIFAAKITGASAGDFFVLPTGNDARQTLLSTADAILRQKASPEKARLVSLRGFGMLDPKDPSKVGLVVRDLYKTFVAPTRAAADPAARAFLDAARRSAAAAAAAALNAGGDDRGGGGGNQALPPGRDPPGRNPAPRRGVSSPSPNSSLYYSESAGAPARGRAPSRGGRDDRLRPRRSLTPPGLRRSRSFSPPTPPRHPRRARSRTPPAQRRPLAQQPRYACLETLAGASPLSLLEIAVAFSGEERWAEVLPDEASAIAGAARSGSQDRLLAAYEAFVLQAEARLSQRVDSWVTWRDDEQPQASDVARVGIQIFERLRAAAKQPRDDRSGRGDHRRHDDRSRRRSPSRSSSRGRDDKRLSHDDLRKALDERGAEQIRSYKDAVNSAAREQSVKRGLDEIDHSSRRDRHMGELPGCMRVALISEKVATQQRQLRSLPHGVHTMRYSLVEGIGKAADKHVVQSSSRTAEVKGADQAVLGEAVRLGSNALGKAVAIAKKSIETCSGKDTLGGLRISWNLLLACLTEWCDQLGFDKAGMEVVTARLSESLDKASTLSVAKLYEWLDKVLDSYEQRIYVYRKSLGAQGMPSFEAAIEDRSHFLERLLTDARSYHGGVEGAKSVKQPNPPKDKGKPTPKGGGLAGGGGAAAAATTAGFKGPLWKNRPTIAVGEWKKAEEMHKKEFKEFCWFYMVQKDGCRHSNCPFEHPANFPTGWVDKMKVITKCTPSK